ncbi:unnamed protein product [Hyaloperonospora brassicae]|uniref:Uncharacterized protein n=1 Tax=Hyaloperonospora brassicae TaxID=162125 RepID=A0AAV0USA4_HYABA|nr:unnamed protein product [Hyaloperonospora brassicae]
MTHWWRPDDLRALLQAWEQTVSAPRDRDELPRSDLQRLFKRFRALRHRDAAPVALRHVEAHRQRLVRTFLFLRAFNAESARSGRPTWFELPLPQQDDLRRLNGRLGALAADRSTADEMKAAAEALAGLPMFRSDGHARPTLSPPSSPAPPRPEQQQQKQLPEDSRGDDLSAPSEESSSEDEVDSERGNTTRGCREKASDMEDTPPKAKSKVKIKSTSKWSKSDETRLIAAWHQVVTSLADNGYAGSFASRNEGLRLNSLIHQRYVELCGAGSPARTNQSTGAKKYAIMMAFRSLRSVLRTLASMSTRPNWFGMTPDERMELQKKHGHHHEHTCLIEKATYQQLAEIDRAQRAVLTPIANALRPPVTLAELPQRNKMRTKVAKRKNSVVSPTREVIAERSSDEEESSDAEDVAAVRSGGKTEESSRSRPLSTAKRLRRNLTQRRNREVDPVKATSPVKRRRTGLSDAKWVTGLLNAQTQRFKSLLDEFQEERRQERQQNLEIILEALKLRSTSAQKPKQPSRFAETLVEKQRQHMVKLFDQLQDERSQERDQARMLLRELRPSRLLSQEQEQTNE